MPSFASKLREIIWRPKAVLVSWVRSTWAQAPDETEPWSLQVARQHSPEGSLSVGHSVLPDSFRLTDCSPPGSPIRGILQARMLEWVAVPFSRGPPALQVDSLPSRPSRKPWGVPKPFPVTATVNQKKGTPLWTHFLDKADFISDCTDPWLTGI